MRPWRSKDGRISSKVGSAVKELYAPMVRDDGVIELVKSGEKNLYEEIQSHKDSVDIHVLLAQYAQGDLNALEKRQGIYEDIVGMPKSYAEMFQKIKDGERAFYELPVEVREKFDHSFEKWLITSGQQDWFEKMQLKGVVSNESTFNEIVKEEIAPTSDE